MISFPKGTKEINFNLKLTFMKTNFIIVVSIILAFLFVGCTTSKNFDFKVSVVPQTYNSITTPSDVNKAAEVINKRLKYFFSIPQKNIKLDVTENQISLTISKIDTGKIDLIKEVITGYNKLEFWETFENSEIIGYLSKASNMLRDMQTAAAGAKIVKTAVLKVPADTIKKEKQDTLFGILSTRVTAQGEPLPSCMIGLVSGKDTSEINKYLKMDQYKSPFPG